jgi:hypothetical protein
VTIKPQLCHPKYDVSYVVLYQQYTTIGSTASPKTYMHPEYCVGVHSLLVHAAALTRTHTQLPTHPSWLAALPNPLPPPHTHTHFVVWMSLSLAVVESTTANVEVVDSTVVTVTWHRMQCHG